MGLAKLWSVASRSGIGPKQVILVFVAALVFYAASYSWIEHRRHRKGAWSVRFEVGQQGEPTVRIDQSWLGITNVTLRFPGERVGTETNSLPQRVDFDKPAMTAPFGDVIYEDLTFLPGVVTFNLFGHLVEFAPRVLNINRREIPWAPGLEVDMNPLEKPEKPPRGPGK